MLRKFSFSRKASQKPSEGSSSIPHASLGNSARVQVPTSAGAGKMLSFMPGRGAKETPPTTTLAATYPQMDSQGGSKPALDLSASAEPPYGQGWAGAWQDTGEVAGAAWADASADADPWALIGSRPGAVELPAEFLAPESVTGWLDCVVTGQLPFRSPAAMPPLPLEQSLREAWPEDALPAGLALGAADAQARVMARSRFDELLELVLEARARRPQLPTGGGASADLLLAALKERAAEGGGRLALEHAAASAEASVRGLSTPPADGLSLSRSLGLGGSGAEHGGGAPVEKLRQSALHASLGGVKALVARAWRLSGRLSASELRALLAEMFRRSAGSAETFEALLELWNRMLTADAQLAGRQGGEGAGRVFLDQDRLALVRYRQAFLASGALHLAVTHAMGKGGRDERCWPKLHLLLATCVPAEARPQLEPMLLELRQMAALVRHLAVPSLLASSATMDMHATALVVADVVVSFAEGAVPKEAGRAIGAAVDDVERTMLLRAMVQQQLDALLAAYARAEAPASARELALVRGLLEQLPMEHLEAVKAQLASEALVCCASVEETVGALNAIKARVLGSGGDGQAHLSAEDILGEVGGGSAPSQARHLAHVKARHEAAAEERRRLDPALGTLHVAVRGVRGLGNGGGEVLALVRCGREKAKSTVQRLSEEGSAPLRRDCRFARVRDNSDSVTVSLLARRALADTSMGEAKIALSFARDKESAIDDFRWHKVGRGEVLVQLRFERLNAKPAGDKADAAELAHRLSGAWCGQSEHRRTSQLLECALSFGRDGTVSGAGADLLGAFEICDGTIAHEAEGPCAVSFTKRYTSLADGA
ncbi:hypothetical protein T492DRAFT_905077, partial [Pavlovales sp. CCMP2436]